MRCIRAQRGKRGPRGRAQQRKKKSNYTFQICLFVRLLKGGARWVESWLKQPSHLLFPFPDRRAAAGTGFGAETTATPISGAALADRSAGGGVARRRRGGQLAAVAATLFGRFPLRLRIQDRRDGVGTTPPSPWPAHSSTRRSCMARYSSWNN